MTLPRFLVSPAKRLWLLVFTYVAGFVLASVAFAVLMNLGKEQLAMLRIGMVAQDLLMLIVPAVATAMIVTRAPARLLCLDRAPGFQPSLLALLTLIVSMPIMNAIIDWNNSWTLDFLPGVADSLRAMEERAAATIDQLMGPHTPGNLIVSVLIMGVLTGFAEELFFRGALLRLLASTRVGTHGAIWVSAIIFSAVHMQFFGFVPRMLLGALFGYLMVWSGSVWLPMLCHAFNNSLYVILQYATGSGDPKIDGTDTWVSVLISVAFTAACLTALYMMTHKHILSPVKQPDNDKQR